MYICVLVCVCVCYVCVCVSMLSVCVRVAYEGVLDGVVCFANFEVCVLRGWCARVCARIAF